LDAVSAGSDANGMQLVVEGRGDVIRSVTDDGDVFAGPYPFLQPPTGELDELGPNGMFVAKAPVRKGVVQDRVRYPLSLGNDR